MNKKQKKNLQRIIIALILVLILKLLPQFPTPVELVLYCIPYLVVGWDVLRKADVYKRQGYGSVLGGLVGIFIIVMLPIGILTSYVLWKKGRIQVVDKEQK